MNCNLLEVILRLRVPSRDWSWTTQLILMEMSKIATIVEDLKLKKRLSKITYGKYGRHYYECVWSNENVRYGPDTCICVIIRFHEHRFKELLKSIKMDEIGKPLFEKLMNKLHGVEEVEEARGKLVSIAEETD